jgi:predicted O-methyltransferase YrrM
MEQWLKTANNLFSSYRENDLGWILFNLVRQHRPYHCVEIGMLYGYSSIFIMAALEKNGLGKLCGYDLWELYPYRHCRKVQTLASIHEAGLAHRLNRLVEADAKHVPLVERGPIDFLHIDISNDGKTYRWAMAAFRDLIKPGGIMVLEGGTIERDHVPWMKKYNKQPIAPVLAESNSAWIWYTEPHFPGMTVFTRTPC